MMTQRVSWHNAVNFDMLDICQIHIVSNVVIHRFNEDAVNENFATKRLLQKQVSPTADCRRCKLFIDNNFKVKQFTSIELFFKKVIQ
jgi:hypothetical protein